MKNILLVGEKYSSNLGDGIIYDTVYKLLNNNKYNIINMDISGRTIYENDTNSFSLFKEYKVYIKSLIKKILSFFKYNKMGKNLSKIFGEFKNQFDYLVMNNHIDYVIFAGGQMFIDTFINQIEYICNYCDKNSISVIFNSCGTGNILNEKALEKVLQSNAVKYISLRDGYEKILSYTGKKVFVCCDNAVYCSNTYKFQRRENGICGIGIMFSTLQSPMKQIVFWKKIIKELLKEKIEFKLFTNGSYKDYCFAKYILKKMNLNIEQYLLIQPKEPIQLVKQISSFEKIISMRLHSMIVAYSYNIPSIAICWDYKVNEFFSKIGLKENCYKLNSKTYEIIDHFKRINNDTIDRNIKKELLVEIDNNIKKIKKIIEK